MKKFLSLMAIIAIIFSANCSRIEQNDDPIIGIWSETKTVSESNTAKTTLRKEWIFNDVYLGRYHELNGNEIIVKTDFKWSQEDGTYTVEYRGLEDKSDDIFTIEKTENGELLQKVDGNMLAIKE
ncbi:hypothetical protein [Maribacter sp. 2304DJ31-5]|uniref:hypothetical protein n=1 Tax=Maribacter sp. 2304DJ31-5 TaxID=3386273 RepID=UPI0039BD4C4F